jgi:Beta-propeller repeat
MRCSKAVMKRQSLGNWLRTSRLGLVSFGVLGLIATACTPVDRNFSTGQGGAGGMGQVCEPGLNTSCYSGPPGTEDIGVCRAGTKTCLPDGTGFDACEGEITPSTEVCTTAADEACDGPNPAECPALQHVWSKSFGGKGEDIITALTIEPISGDIIGTGVFNEKIDFGGNLMASTGGEDVFLFRMTADGQHKWSKRFGDASSQNGRAIALDSMGNIYVTGEVAGLVDFGDGKPLMSKGSSDAFVAKFDPDGSLIWSRLFGDAESQEGLAIAVSPTNQVVVAGTFSGFIPLTGFELPSNTNSKDIFVIKLDSSGFDVGAKSYGSPMTEQLLDMTVDSKGAILIAGSFTDVISFGQLGTFTSAGSADAFVLKLKDDLNEQWARTYGDIEFQRAGSVVTSPNDDIFLMGDFTGSMMMTDGSVLQAPGTMRSIFLISLTPDGALRWSKSTGNGQSFVARQMLVSDAASQSIIAVGFYDASVDFGGGPLDAKGVDSYVARMSWGGQHIASTRFGGVGIDAFFDVATSPAGDVFVGGTHQGPADFGGGELPSPEGPNDFQALLMRLLP